MEEYKHNGGLSCARERSRDKRSPKNRFVRINETNRSPRQSPIPRSIRHPEETVAGTGVSTSSNGNFVREAVGSTNTHALPAMVRELSGVSSKIPISNLDIADYICSLPGPRDIFRQLEDDVHVKGLKFNLEHLLQARFPIPIIEQWIGGHILQTPPESDIVPPHFMVENYSSILEDPELAAAEITRASQNNKVLIYPLNSHFLAEQNNLPTSPSPIPDLRVAPCSLIQKGSRLRLVTDWSNPQAALNSWFAEEPSPCYGNIFQVRLGFVYPT